jgi:hypothetical protein
LYNVSISIQYEILGSQDGCNNRRVGLGYMNITGLEIIKVSRILVRFSRVIEAGFLFVLCQVYNEGQQISFVYIDLSIKELLD